MGPPEVDDLRSGKPPLSPLGGSGARRVLIVIRPGENPNVLFYTGAPGKANHFIRYSRIFVLSVFLLIPRVFAAFS